MKVTRLFRSVMSEPFIQTKLKLSDDLRTRHNPEGAICNHGNSGKSVGNFKKLINLRIKVLPYSLYSSGLLLSKHRM
jgi:hypothetical protein